MIDKIEKRFEEMTLECFTPKEMYYLILALQEFELYKLIKGSDVEIRVSTLTPEDYD
jgi:hypothetical protein